jgi:hypothetical protein
MRVAEAVRVVLEAAAAEQATVPATASSTYYDQNSAPCGENQFKIAAKAGKFRTWRVGKRLLARRDDVDRWIESPAHEVTPGVIEPTDDIDTLLLSGGVARKSDA